MEAIVVMMTVEVEVEDVVTTEEINIIINIIEDIEKIEIEGIEKIEKIEKIGETITISIEIIMRKMRKVIDRRIDNKKKNKVKKNLITNDHKFLTDYSLLIIFCKLFIFKSFLKKYNV